MFARNHSLVSSFFWLSYSNFKFERKNSFFWLKIFSLMSKSWERYLIVCNICSSIFSDNTVFKRHSVFKRQDSSPQLLVICWYFLFYLQVFSTIKVFSTISRYSPYASTTIPSPYKNKHILYYII